MSASCIESIALEPLAAQAPASTPTRTSEPGPAPASAAAPARRAHEVRGNRFQRARRTFSEGMDPILSGNIDIERLQRLADRGQRTRNRLCLWCRPCKNPIMWFMVGTIAVGIGGLIVYGLTQVLEKIL